MICALHVEVAVMRQQSDPAKYVRSSLIIKCCLNLCGGWCQSCCTAEGLYATLWLTLVQEEGEGDSVVVIEERPHNDIG